MRSDPALVVRNPAELIAALPFLMGYHPRDSVALVGMRGRDLDFGACFDLPPPGGDEREIRRGVRETAETVRRQHPGGLMIIGYGAAQRVTPVVLCLVEALHGADIRVDEVLRVDGGRWWSYLCTDPGCCSPDGQPCLPADSVIAAEATYLGQVALPDRAAMVAQVAAVDGPARAAMVAATERARRRFGELVRETEGRTVGKRIRQAGRAAIREVERRYRSGAALGDDEVAWLGVMLTDRAVEDYALDRLDGTEWRVRLWTDVVRRVEPVYVPAPACLLGFSAWRLGRGALARVAADRALAVDPGHDLAVTLNRVLGFGFGPAVLRGGSR
ncbi:DUF4192 domain-containing protein [Actinoplanes sp. G11-F43]|uniref:DUF4192 domain-containing protein n=1 Tax=Actinoplanes sp. G11-F43 TaxID=3424130 RepID=UPI003D34E569